jgi:hypothetical protein
MQINACGNKFVYSMARVKHPHAYTPQATRGHYSQKILFSNFSIFAPLHTFF